MSLYLVHLKEVQFSVMCFKAHEETHFQKSSSKSLKIFSSEELEEFTSIQNSTRTEGFHATFFLCTGKSHSSDVSLRSGPSALLHTGIYWLEICSHGKVSEDTGPKLELLVFPDLQHGVFTSFILNE